jgi:hypothetical protein
MDSFPDPGGTYDGPEIPAWLTLHALIPDSLRHQARRCVQDAWAAAGGLMDFVSGYQGLATKIQTRIAEAGGRDVEGLEHLVHQLLGLEDWVRVLRHIVDNIDVVKRDTSIYQVLAELAEEDETMPQAGYEYFAGLNSTDDD